ncbi:MAG: UDP-N-acetylmuramate--L-alanine ligase [Micavibrio aeruginosavorus]|uniref:UDP-N-acetylmuramate--L-alanine ligase n=1 Tax=Micavibrio aeruginosavorus TaxID=349221 RepID=A0A7T5R237_9BACT|nr:MAG: UDP-N-acetylmuramate--L-alanine ligase [Micavibrio aeruginosavorus]
MKPTPLDVGTIHFVGIGGIGMSGIAEVLHNLGYTVQGSDIADNYNVKRLRDAGVKIAIGHKPENLVDAEGGLANVVVISSAVKKDNPELMIAREHKLPIVRRADMLAELMRLKSSIAIAGTHGKTTTTTMIGMMLEEAGFDPTIINGGIVNKYGTNTRLGQSDWMVVEADESDGTFTHLPATIGVVTNIDPEHMDYYGAFENVRQAYYRFIENLPFYGYAVLCIDHPEVQGLIPEVTDKRIVTYGFNPQADVHAFNVRSDARGSVYDVKFADSLSDDGRELIVRDMSLPMLGVHNVLNSLAALSVAIKMDVPVATMKKALAGFSGVKRRFTKTGESHGLTVIDDYGHHPVEIMAVLKAGRLAVAESGGRVIAVVQPHRYTRLSSLFDEFCTCFYDADAVIVADVYAAGEQPVEGADRDHLAQGIKAHGHKNVQLLNDPAALAGMIADIGEPNDLVICLGAGDITKWAYALPGELDTVLNERKKQRA